MHPKRRTEMSVINYDGYLIRKYSRTRNYGVYDWDYETETLVFVASSMNEARAWIDRRNYP
jgi:hypothetical protein